MQGEFRELAKKFPAGARWICDFRSVSGVGGDIGGVVEAEGVRIQGPEIRGEGWEALVGNRCVAWFVRPGHVGDWRQVTGDRTCAMEGGC